METLVKLVALASLSALSLFAMTTIYTNSTIEIQYVAFAVNLVILSITALAFSTFTALDAKTENLKLKLKLAKIEHSPLKDLVAYMKAKNEAEVEVTGCEKVECQDPGTEEGDNTGVTFTEVDTGLRMVHDTKINESDINPRTKKPYKISFAKRMELREKAIKREQDKRIRRTAQESKKRKSVKAKKTV